MRIVTWNVNSIRSRLEHLVELLAEHSPDVVCLQELKCVDEQFPAERIAETGYEFAAYGQKTYNGVAILSKVGLANVRRGFDDGDAEDEQSRIVRADCGPVRVVCVYVPNGKDLDTDKYEYKLAWYQRLRDLLASQEDASRDLVLTGDFNICPETRDMWNPEAEGSIFSSPPERERLAELLEWGLTDVHRLHDQSDGLFTWWDYRRLAYPKRKGLRIDLVLATASLTAKSTACVVDRRYRKLKTPSDHAPVLADFEL